MSALGVSLLSRLSRPSVEKPHSFAENLEQASISLRPLIPDLSAFVRGKVVLDFGSGEGWHALAFGEAGARKVYGIEIDAPKVERSRERAAERKLEDRVSFELSIPDACLGTCDVILSRDCMEHYQDPEAILLLMKRSLSPDGQILITFGPTWFSPYGAHMNYFAPIPWVHLLFSEESIMTVRSLYRADGAKRFEEVPGGLNRMSVARFEKLIQKCGMKIVRMERHCVRGKKWLGIFPVVRELFINSIECTLQHR